MKPTNIVLKQAFLLTFFFLAFNSAAFVLAQETTNPQRQRVAASPTPTPKAQTSPTVTPTPVPVPTQTPSVQTLPELQSQIRSVLFRPELVRSQVGVKVVSLASGKTVFEQNADKYFMPASNMKSFTVAAALDRLTPNFRFVTSVYAAQPADATGTLRGDLIIYGRGDPSFSTAFSSGDYYAGINALADKIAASGVKRIEGNLIGDESYFSGDAIGSSWEWDDLQWYYGTEISALTINDNAVDLKISPGANVGTPCVVTILPANSVFTIINLTTTSAAGTKRELEVTKRLGTNVLEVRGSMPRGDKDYTGYIAVSHPAEMFLALLKNALAQKGITVTGQTRAVTANDRKLAPLNVTNLSEIARLESPPLSLIAAKTLKPSQNLYTELILRALGENAGDKTDARKTSAERGLEVVQKFLTENGIAPNSVVQWDGSGLSRHNLITPAAAAQLYAQMSRNRFAQTWRDALTIAGVDGTLQNRFKGTAAAGNVRGKTGTIDQVSALSGYVTTAAGEPLAFSVIVNNLPGASAVQRATIDDIVLALANFHGKTN